MYERSRYLAVMVFGGLCIVAVTAASDWPHWRGPTFNGATSEASLPSTWSAEKNVAWTAAMPGASAATPVIVDGRVFISSTVRGGKDLVGLCYSAADGELLWRKKLAVGGRVSRNTHATCSPVGDAKHVYFLFGTGVLVALDRDGRELWRRDLAADYGPVSIKFGYSSSPLLLAGRLYIAVVRGAGTARLPSGKQVLLDSFLLAVEAATGKTLWRYVRKTDAAAESQQSYSSPIAYETPQGSAVLVAGGDYLTCHAADTGREMWRFRYVARRHRMHRLVPSPVPAGKVVLASVPRGTGLIAVRPPAAGGKPTPAWSYTGPNPDVCTPLVYDGLIYLLDGGHRKLTCLDPAGKAGKAVVLWQQELKGWGPFRASPTGADGKVYCIDAKGTTFVYAAGRTAKRLAVNRLTAGEVFATIAVADGKLFVRAERTLFCIAKGPADTP